jgi:non-specific serine/threonine protein kinase
MHQRLGHRWMVTFDLLALTGVLLAAGHPREGVRFMAVAQAMTDRLGSPVGGASFADIDEVIAQVDRLRREDWFEPVWVAGYALDPGEAVEVARGLLDEPGSPGQGPEPATPARTPLTRRELEVARLLAEGYTDRQIADTLYIAVSTASRHVHHILEKLDLQSRVQVAGWLASREPPDVGSVNPTR